jgi:hypothetical protein
METETARGWGTARGWVTVMGWAMVTGKEKVLVMGLARHKLLPAC